MAAPAPATHAAQSARGGASVSLLAADPEFASAVPAAERPLAGAVRLPLLKLPAGGWDVPDGGASATGWLIAGGLLVRTLQCYGRASVEMHGAGDLLSIADPKAGRATWSVVQDTSLIALDEDFELAARRWPALWRVVLARSSQRVERLTAHMAALQMSRVDERVEAVMWQLADRFGRVTPDGVVLPLRLTHQTLGFLTAAKRPTVSVALGELAARGRVSRRTDGGWLLRRPGFGLDDNGSERRRRFS